MKNIINSLMSGGWELDNDLDPATDYELKMEAYEADHPEEFRIYNPADYVGPFTIWKAEYEVEEQDLFTAIQRAKRCIEEGSDAIVIDNNGDEVPLFVRWN